MQFNILHKFQFRMYCMCKSLHNLSFGIIMFELQSALPIFQPKLPYRVSMSPEKWLLSLVYSQRICGNEWSMQQLHLPLFGLSQHICIMYFLCNRILLCG